MLVGQVWSPVGADAVRKVRRAKECIHRNLARAPNCLVPAIGSTQPSVTQQRLGREVAIGKLFARLDHNVHEVVVEHLFGVSRTRNKMEGYLRRFSLQAFDQWPQQDENGVI